MKKEKEELNDQKDEQATKKKDSQEESASGGVKREMQILRERRIYFRKRKPSLETHLTVQ